MEIGFGEDFTVLGKLSPPGSANDHIEVRETRLLTSTELELCQIRNGKEERSIFLTAANEDELYEILRQRREAQG